MKYLLDTHILLWAAYEPEKLPGSCRDKLSDRNNMLLFSSASIWEISIKTSLGRYQFPDLVFGQATLDDWFLLSR